MSGIVHVLIGDLPSVGDVAIKTSALFLTAAILFRFSERRTLAEFAPFDWTAAVSAGAIVGRAATATDTGWLQATTALLCVLPAHAVLARLRLIPALCRLIDPPLMVLRSVKRDSHSALMNTARAVPANLIIAATGASITLLTKALLRCRCNVSTFRLNQLEMS